MLEFVKQWFVIVPIAGLICTSGCTTFPSSASSFADFLAEKPVDDQLAIAKIKENRGDLEEAQEDYRQILKSNPNHAESLHQAAVLASKMSSFDDAERLFQESLAVEKPTAKLLNDYGYHLFLQDELEKAEEYFRKAVDEDPEFVPALTNLGLTLGEMGRFDEARRTFQRAAKMPTEVFCNMGYVFANQGKFDLARKEYDHALEIEPDCEVAVEGLIQVAGQIPGSEPKVVLRTHGKRAKSVDLPENSLNQPPAKDEIKVLPPVVQVASPFTGER